VLHSLTFVPSPVFVHTEFTNIAALTPGTQGHNLLVKVLHTTVALVKARTDGTRVRVTECVIGDATGIVSFLAHDGE
jgi:ssDNA-binding replication factor A large subunit